MGKNIEKFIIATHNKHKIVEFERILKPLGISVVTADLPEVEEDGATFEENALKKAESAFLATGMCAVADDSGLMVDYLNGAPGVYSARFAGSKATDADNNQKLLAQLAGVPEEKRTARFVSAIACVGEGIRFTVKGFCEGKIAFAPQGDEGFGYDPLFISEKGCFGLLPGEVKDSISHRGAALLKFKERLEEILNAEQ